MTAPPDPAAPPERPRPSPALVVAGVAGELLLTAGVVVLLFVVWQLAFTAVVDGRAQAGTVQALERGFAAAPGSTPGGTAPSAPTPTDLATGRAWGVLRVPRLGGPTWAKPVLEGVGLDVLADGLGHYPGTALPGEVGNLAIAGHRAGHGNPLIDIDAIRPGDVLVIETRAGWYVYRAVRSEIVAPTAVDVLDPVPERPGEQPSERWFTLTSCNPRYGSSMRYVVFSRFERMVPRGEGLPSGLLADPRTAA
ncbi:class E sortase [Lapillicoccus jejuensis]|uniref:Sortase A n=1 Tax=Lapillicoccus jejuensis TaxID=402171 RepID=A0A542DZ42_9MICO|nr:class E sortase [Lapillicoccus jejuensis]TQJ08319.1 sortase A [Lapillicoccus jejuensis]